MKGIVEKGLGHFFNTLHVVLISSIKPILSSISLSFGVLDIKPRYLLYLLQSWHF